MFSYSEAWHSQICFGDCLLRILALAWDFEFRFWVVFSRLIIDNGNGLATPWVGLSKPRVEDDQEGATTVSLSRPSDQINAKDIDMHSFDDLAQENRFVIYAGGYSGNSLWPRDHKIRYRSNASKLRKLWYVKSLFQLGGCYHHFWSNSFDI